MKNQATKSADAENYITPVDGKQNPGYHPEDNTFGPAEMDFYTKAEEDSKTDRHN